MSVGAPNGMVAGAVGLTESGVLVNGLCVTDLLSGYELRCEPAGPADPTRPDDGPVFCGSQVPLHRLEAVRELVEDVLGERAGDPELTSANPVVPRTVFPWGIGLSTTDILVAGPDKDATAAYLRIMGLRARTVDVSQALRLAGDLAAARADVAQPAGPDPEYGDPGGVPDVPDVPDGPDDAASGRPTPRRVKAKAFAAVAVVAVVLVVGAVVVRSTQPGAPVTPVHAGASGAGTESETGPAVEPDDSSDRPGPDPAAGDWRELQAGNNGPGDGTEPVSGVVTVEVPGWRMTDSTPDREIWTSGDEGMRVLVAARPTPVGTQGELDAAMLGALDGLDGNGEIVVTSRSPVDYEEYFPDSTTSWRVRLIDGHQVSVGCQYREVSADRRDVCERFTATARVAAATGRPG